MKLDDFYKVVRSVAMEAVGYTIPKGSLDSAIAYLGIGATLGRNTKEFLSRPFVKAALPKLQSLGIVDAAVEDVDVDAVLSGLAVCVEQGVKIDIGTFTIDAQEFRLLTEKLEAVSGRGNNKQGRTDGTAGVVVGAPA